MADLLEAGEVGCPSHLYTGQEAVAVGVCAALQPADYVWGGHRSHGHYLAKGGDMQAMMAEIYGKVSGCSGGRGGSMHLLAPEVGILGTVPIVAGTIPLAVGTGLASKLRKDHKVSVSFFGDGAVEEGHFHESLNLAALYKLPVIFVCENNSYSSHMSLLERRAEDNIHLAGQTHGIPGTRLDGNSVIEVYEAVLKAVKRARNGEGPTLLECRTYRWRGHVGPSKDMDVGVKRKDEMGEWLPKDPLTLARNHLLKLGKSSAELKKINLEVQKEIRRSIAFARTSSYPDVDTILDHVYTTKDSQ